MFRVLSISRQLPLLSVVLCLAACTSSQAPQHVGYKPPQACPDGRVQYCDDRTGRGCTCISKGEIRALMALF